MECHKELLSTNGYKPDLNEGPQAYFNKAWKFVQKFYPEAIDLCRSVRFEDVDPDFFFREYVWVVHATGFSAKVVGRLIPRLLGAYGVYDDLADKDFDAAFEEIGKVCNNRQKAKAVWRTAQLMQSEIGLCQDGWNEFKQKWLSSPKKLKELPYIGPITCFHLARNIGLLEYVKPDLHLVRMAEHWGFSDCIKMCEAVRPEGMPLGIVDLILWFSASHWGTLEIRKHDGR